MAKLGGESCGDMRHCDVESVAHPLGVVLRSVFCLLCWGVRNLWICLMTEALWRFFLHLWQAVLTRNVGNLASPDLRSPTCALIHPITAAARICGPSPERLVPASARGARLDVTESVLWTPLCSSTSRLLLSSCLPMFVFGARVLPFLTLDS